MDAGEAARHEGGGSELGSFGGEEGGVGRGKGGDAGEGRGGPGAWGEDVHEAVRRRIAEVERWKEWVM
ncbi:hypothetical protein B0H12DRAFT_1168734 [Mycena haematopus]|nr:hypothetical protein B0H12DRAFT_1168734 [Mycena haematopus]